MRHSGPNVIRPYDRPLWKRQGFSVGGNLFVRHHEDVRDQPRFPPPVLTNPDPKKLHFACNRLRGTRGLPASNQRSVTGDRCELHAGRPRRWSDRVPGSRRSSEYDASGLLGERRRPHAALLGDGRQSGTSDSPSILNARRKRRPEEISQYCRQVTACVLTCETEGSTC